MMNKLDIRLSLCGILFQKTDSKLLPKQLQEILEEPCLHTIFTPNPEILVATWEKPEYLKTLQSATLHLPDGVGLLWATTFLAHTKEMKSSLQIVWEFFKTYSALLLAKHSLKKYIPETLPGSDTWETLHKICEDEKASVFYLGGEHGVSENIIPVMQKEYPNISYVGASGAFPFRSAEDNQQLLEEISLARPQIVFVCLGAPKQETWIMQNFEALEKAGVRIALGLGGTIDFAVGKAKRAPRVFRSFGLEWLWRLLLEPWRWKRILTAVFYFPWKILVKRLRNEKDLLILFPPLDKTNEDRRR